MTQKTDPTALLRALAENLDDAFDPDGPTARASLEGILATSAIDTGSSRRRSRRRLRFAVVPLTVATMALAALAVALSLSSSRTGIAKAAVISRAAAALEQPSTITYLQIQAYTAHGSGCVAVVATGLCIAGSSPEAPDGLSADPADDTVTYSYREWLSPGGDEEHTIYGNGAETVRNTSAHQDETYDPADNTLTTLSDTSEAPTPPSAAASPFPSSSNFVNPTYYENLYSEAQAGKQNVQLLGKTEIGGESVYELQFDIDPRPPANPPAGDMCGPTVCTPPDMEILLYLDSQNFTPVRNVTSIVNTQDRPGIPDGTSVSSIVDFTVESLPDTPANQSLLQISPHPGATRIQQTEAQDRAERGASLEARVAVNRARAKGGSSTARAASSRHRAPPKRRTAR